MCLHGGPLPTSEDLVVEDAELRSFLAAIAKRSAGGRAVSGRYNKHDTARLRFIRSIALPGIRFGKLVPDDDMRMLRLGPKASLHGADLASMDEWSQRHGRDPRSKKKDGWLDEGEQATLFRWLSRNERHHVISDPVRRGSSKQYKLDFGAYKGYRLGQLVQHSMSTGGSMHLLPAEERSESTPRPGEYILWLAGETFDWHFPYHLHLYLNLKSLELNGACVGVGGVGGPKQVRVSERVDNLYEVHAAETLAPPPADEPNPYVGVAARAAMDGAEEDDDADADPPWVPLDDIERIENGISNVQNEYFHSTRLEIRDGERAPYSQWKRFDTVPDDPTCGECFDADEFELMPIDWWSPAAKWASKGVTSPCVVGGWSHTHAVTLGEWRQRRVKGLSSDRCIAGQRTSCSICKARHDHLKKQLDALKTQDLSSPQIGVMEAEIKATPYRASTLHPKYNQLLFERFNWLAVKMPAVITHRAAISTEVLDVIARAGRTSQTAHDLEAMFRESRCVHARAHVHAHTSRTSPPPLSASHHHHPVPLPHTGLFETRSCGSPSTACKSSTRA